MGSTGVGPFESAKHPLLRVECQDVALAEKLLGFTHSTKSLINKSVMAGRKR